MRRPPWSRVVFHRGWYKPLLVTAMIMGLRRDSSRPSEGSHLGWLSAPKWTHQDEEMAMSSMNATIRAAEGYLDRFESEKNGELLLLAYRQLGRVTLYENTPDENTKELYRRGLRQQRPELLRLWLRLFRLVDESLDPQYDPNSGPILLNVPFLASDPPVWSSRDVDYNDPVLRADWERRIAENQEKARYHTLQSLLRRVDRESEESFGDFLRDEYLPTERDREELAEAIRRGIQSPERITRFLRMIR
jgi:hypothetical protein